MDDASTLPWWARKIDGGFDDSFNEASHEQQNIRIGSVLGETLSVGAEHPRCALFSHTLLDRNVC